MNSPDSPFLPHGGYRKLRSYKVAEAVYDATVVFCRRFSAQDRRMSDQMVQAARSGVRNISEGSSHLAQKRDEAHERGSRKFVRRIAAGLREFPHAERASRVAQELA